MNLRRPPGKSAKRAAKKAPVKARTTARAPSRAIPTVYDRLHAVLHSVRVIAHFEDSLCVLLEHVKTAGHIDQELSQELVDVLERLPARLYLEDVEALRAALPAFVPKSPRRAVKRTSAKRASAKRSR